MTPPTRLSLPTLRQAAACALPPAPLRRVHIPASTQRCLLAISSQRHIAYLLRRFSERRWLSEYGILQRPRAQPAGPPTVPCVTYAPSMRYLGCFFWSGARTLLLSMQVPLATTDCIPAHSCWRCERTQWTWSLRF